MEEKRLNELLKQRALIEEHLIWIDAEIDEAQQDGSLPAPSPIPANRLQKIDEPILEKPSALPIEDPDPNLAVSDIYDELGPETRNSAKDAQRGCLGIFAFAFLVLAALVVWVYAKY